MRVRGRGSVVDRHLTNGLLFFLLSLGVATPTPTVAQEMEADLLSCANMCWWPAQVPDSLQSSPEWAKACSGMNQEDWKNFEIIFPKTN